MRRCAFCNQPPALLRRECTPPDMSTEIFRYFCDNGTCEAKWGTNQPKPYNPGDQVGIGIWEANERAHKELRTSLALAEVQVLLKLALSPDRWP